MSYQSFRFHCGPKQWTSALAMFAILAYVKSHCNDHSNLSCMDASTFPVALSWQVVFLRFHRVIRVLVCKPFVRPALQKWYAVSQHCVRFCSLVTTFCSPGATKLRILKIGGTGIIQKGFDAQMLRMLACMRQLTDLRLTCPPASQGVHNPQPHLHHHPGAHQNHPGLHHALANALMADEDEESDFEDDLELDNSDMDDPYGEF